LKSALFEEILQVEGLLIFIWYRTNHSIMNNIYVLIFIGFVDDFNQIVEFKSFSIILIVSCLF